LWCAASPGRHVLDATALCGGAAVGLLLKMSCLSFQQGCPSSITELLRLVHGWQPECGGVGAGLDVAASQGTGCRQRARHAATPSPRDVGRGLAGSDDEEKDGTREHADGDVWTCDEAWRRERMHARQGSKVRGSIVVPSVGATGKKGTSRKPHHHCYLSTQPRSKTDPIHTARSHIILKHFPDIYNSSVEHLRPSAPRL
jgi:hypothetical protein